MRVKKLLCSILALAMILSTMGTTALADNAEADVWDGTVDISWYNDTDTEFTITTAEQWAGLAELVNDAESYSPARGNEETADFGWYCGKQASPDATANGIDFDGVTIKLAADLDLRAVYENGDPVLLPGKELLSMAPVGYSTYTPFKGTFDGQGHTIKNLFQGGWDLYKYADSSDGVYLGLFGVVEDATIKNLVIDNFSFNCEMNLGGVAGKSGGTSTFDGITVKNSTVATGGGWWVGGLIGWAYGNQTIKNINIDESNTIAQVGGHYDTAVGGIIGGCDNVDGESIAFINCDVSCKLDVYNDCTANYDTGVYRNCGMVIGGIGETIETVIDGVKYPDFEAKGLSFENVKVNIGEWANYTYCWSYSLLHNCQRVEPGVGYEGVDVSTLADYSITSRPFDAIFGAENAGDLSNVRGPVNVRVMDFLNVEGVSVVDEAYIARTEAELYKPADVVLFSAGETEWVLVDSYATLEEALASAQEGYKVKLVKDIEIDQVNTAENKGSTNWNGDYSFLINIPVELTLDLNGCKIEATGGSTLRAPFAVIVNDKGLTIEDSSEEKTGAIVLNASEYSDVWLSSVIYNRSALTLNGGALINKLNDTDSYAIDNTTVSKGVSFTMNGGSVASDYDTALRVGSQGSSGTLNVVINDGTVDGGIWVPLKNGGKDIVNLAINGGTIGANSNGNSLVIENYAAASAGAEADVLSITNGVFEGYVGIGENYVSEVITEGFISGGTYVNNVADYVSEGFEPQRTGYGYTVVADQTGADDVGKDQADSISIEYKDITATDTEGEKTYAIVVKANDSEMINELASVDLSLIFTETPVTNGDITFTVLPAETFAVTEHEDSVRNELEKRYMFNYNGVDAFEGTANAITIGTITVTGYGKYTIETADVSTNIVNATTVQDNLVDSYTAAGATDDDATTGGLVINTDTVTGDDMVGEITDGEIAVPTRELTITIDFPNAVADNAADYQDMKVEITGNIDGTNQTVTYDLGGNMTDGAYVVTEDRLVLNDAYTVTVSGEGYRTARYTVTMTDDKQLKFWNNVMDEAQVVEIGKDSSVAKVTFLAGDIVKDNKINIYDLSAVVSYFGTENLVTEHPEYVKYDLNRDGVIDSKDVAYVLVSWNN